MADDTIVVIVVQYDCLYFAKVILLGKTCSHEAYVLEIQLINIPGSVR